MWQTSCMEIVRKRTWYASTKDVKVSRLERGEVLGAAALVLQQIFTTGQIRPKTRGGRETKACPGARRSRPRNP